MAQWNCYEFVLFVATLKARTGTQWRCHESRNVWRAAAAFTSDCRPVLDDSTSSLTCGAAACRGSISAKRAYSDTQNARSASERACILPAAAGHSIRVGRLHADGSVRACSEHEQRTGRHGHAPPRPVPVTISHACMHGPSLLRACMAARATSWRVRGSNAHYH